MAASLLIQQRNTPDQSRIPTGHKTGQDPCLPLPALPEKTHTIIHNKPLTMIVCLVSKYSSVLSSDSPQNNPPLLDRRGLYSRVLIGNMKTPKQCKRNHLQFQSGIHSNSGFTLSRTPHVLYFLILKRQSVGGKSKILWQSQSEWLVNN